jgi:hypothetical protein
MKTSELTGVALDWAAAKAKGYSAFVLDPKRFIEMHETGHYNYSIDWAQGGPIIEREWLDVTPWPNESDEDMRWQCKQHDTTNGCTQYGPTPLVAAMRCYVASKLGEEVEVPHELA